jgi:hypothetical protein
MKMRNVLFAIISQFIKAKNFEYYTHELFMNRITLFQLYTY